MNTKLTLRLEKDLIDSAKKYSAKNGKSVSRLVSDYFELIQNEKTPTKETLSPIVRSLKGIIRDKNLDERDYQKYLEEKHR